MAGRGLFLAIDDFTLKQLRATKGDALRRDFIHELEEVIDSQYVQETDKAWEFIFVALYTGKTTCGMEHPDLVSMSKIFRGAKNLHRGDSYILNWVAKAEFPELVVKFEQLHQSGLRELYDTCNQGWFHAGVYKGTDEQFEYISNWYDRIVQFFARMRAENRHILFTSNYN